MVQNLGSAMADVVVDAMIAEAARYDRASFAGDLQSISWMAMALGGICGSLLGGYVLSNLQIDTIFLLFAVLPTIQLISCQLWLTNLLIAKLFKSIIFQEFQLQTGLLQMEIVLSSKSLIKY
ncbi:probable folate-biopterin transporter 4 isoform X3 [Prosopis cineraria]|uniref:probable folate-biopterin transporter 4 isoform X3 n=1 Tax=Prosopis cineraria TaxID=364024 RepID=UPI00241019C3|nr:probable folate-biopterin transporter 4 isoform X3 [Prosopis cineraria]